MHRRNFLGLAASAALSTVGPQALAQGAPATLPPMALGLLVKPFGAEEETIRRVQELGFRACFLSLDGYIGHFTPELATKMRGLLDRYGVVATLMRSEP